MYYNDAANYISNITYFYNDEGIKAIYITAANERDLISGTRQAGLSRAVHLFSETEMLLGFYGTASDSVVNSIGVITVNSTCVPSLTPKAAQIQSNSTTNPIEPEVIYIVSEPDGVLKS